MSKAAENEKQRETNHCDKESECSSVNAERPETENSESDKSNETINRDDITGKEMKSVDEANDPDETNIQQASEQFAMERKETTQEADKVKENVEDIDKNKKSKTDKGPGSTKGDEETNGKEHEPCERVEKTEQLSVDECARVSENKRNDKDADVNVSDASEEFAVERQETIQEADKGIISETNTMSKAAENEKQRETNHCDKESECSSVNAERPETENSESDKSNEIINRDDITGKEMKSVDEANDPDETNIQQASEQLGKERKETTQEADKGLGSTKGDEETNVKEHETCERVEKTEQLSVDECARGNEAVVNEQKEAYSDDARMMDEIYEARSLVKDEFRIVLIGKTGSGKSATGNLLTGTKTFDSTASASSVTKYSQSVKYERFGRHLQVVDTPGMFDTQATDSEITKEIKRCLLLTSPGIHALVLVSRVGRFTEEERNCVEFFKNIFGSGLTNYLMIVFTGKDDLDDDDKSVESYLRTAPPSLQDLVGEANNRYIAINNKASKKEKEATARGLIELISEMVEKNGGNCYTSDLFRKAEEVIKQREEEERKRIEEKKKLERESIENNVKQKFDVVLKEQEKSMTRLMKDMEKQEKRHDKQVMDLRMEKKEQAERYEDMLRNERKENKRRRKEERRMREQERIAAQQQQLHLEQMIQSQMKRQRQRHDHQANVAEPEKNRSCSVM